MLPSIYYTLTCLIYVQIHVYIFMRFVRARFQRAARDSFASCAQWLVGAACIRSDFFPKSNQCFVRQARQCARSTAIFFFSNFIFIFFLILFYFVALRWCRLHFIRLYFHLIIFMSSPLPFFIPCASVYVQELK